MTINEMLGLGALALSSMHAITHGLAVLRPAWSSKPAAAVAATSTTTSNKEIVMSESNMNTGSGTQTSPGSVVNTWARNAFAFLEATAVTAGNDWTTIKNSQAYQTLKPLAEQFALQEMNANGIPPTGAVAVGKAIEAGLDQLAALHPVIVTQ